ncbi:pimeloyl-ACP methyl ester carboxylesterase [Pedobacter sp. AK013]|uniref:alpha/beta fold hydrolase n=1 Tax=Pedobacter sp. AK013 TaxID=2723071 RepID=UPI00161BD317|nr:alpha/beta hydrolase [Pedobacter sp. AK013]MBB6235960.1 pimeloyl-ACP methyl ester carboxylesterase [Pedobacter sp. AK013]
MLRSIFTIVFAFYQLSSFSQTSSDSLKYAADEYNLGFEKLISNTKFASKWFSIDNSKGVMIITDTIEKHSGQHSLLIENLNSDGAAKYVQSGIFILSKYEGREVEIRLYAKLKDVAHHVDFSVRIDDQDYDMLQYKNSLKTRISGNRDWQQYSLILPLSHDARRICFWPALYGSGKLWIDDVQVLIDGVDISQAKIKLDYDPNAPQPINYGGNTAASGKVKVKDAELYYETYGKGEPLLLLHGNSQSINVFKKQIKTFAKTYKVIAVDTRGQGKSTDSSVGPLSYDLYAEDMKTLLDSLHISKTNILGWSDGGNTGLIMAAKYPTYVKKLAVTGACTNPNEAVSASTLEEVSKAIESLKTKQDVKSKYQVRLFTMLLTEPHITALDLKHIKAPVLVMAGEKDMILEKHTKFIAANIPKSQLFIFKGASHYVPVEMVSEFNTKVLSFLDK